MSDTLIIAKIDMEFLKKRPLSYSSLKAFRKSPRHYVKYLEKEFDPGAFVKGSIVDALVFYTEEEINKRFHVYKYFKKRTNKAKAQWKEMVELATANKQKLITTEEYEEAMKIRDALYANPQACGLLERRKRVQQEIRWIDSNTKLPVIVIIDFETTTEEGAEYIVDLKTTKDADPENFHSDIFKYHYNIQGASCALGYQKKYFSFPNFGNLAIETESPYCISFNHYTPAVMEAAKEEFYGLLLAFKRCMDNNQWNMGYEFWLMETRSSFTVNQPVYYKSRVKGYTE